MTVTGGSKKRRSLAALIAVKPGQRPRLIYRVHTPAAGARSAGLHRKEYARLLDAAHAQLAGPVVLLRDNLNAHVSGVMAELVVARDWLTVYRLPPYAHELNPVEPAWPVLKKSLANLVKHNIGELPALAKTRLRRMQYRPGLLKGSLAGTRLDLTPFCNHPRIEDRSDLLHAIEVQEARYRLLMQGQLPHRSSGSDLGISAASAAGLSLS